MLGVGWSIVSGTGPGLWALLPAGVGGTPGPRGHTALELLMKPLRWEIILF